MKSKALFIVLLAAVFSSELAQSAPARPQLQQQLLPTARKAEGNKFAISKVKAKFPGTRVLSIDSSIRKGVQVHRVKTLHSNGVIKYIYVDSSGDLVE